MDYEKAIARIYEHLEENHVEKAVMGCLRVARSAKDYLNAAIFLRELYPDKKEVVRALYDDTSHLSKEDRKFLYETSLDRWMEAHTVELSPTTKTRMREQAQYYQSPPAGDLRSVGLRLMTSFRLDG